jgi:pimeloyl-ACP methyl ester carboxylesterase
VICIDNRGVPAPRGRAFRKSIYRRIGILASSDQATAVEKILSSRSYLDPDRVAVWGWSGGGSMSLNLLFRSPEIYSTAISVAPVPDMNYYDTIYQVFSPLPVLSRVDLFTASAHRLLVHGHRSGTWDCPLRTNKATSKAPQSPLLTK